MKRSFLFILVLILSLMAPGQGFSQQNDTLVLQPGPLTGMDAELRTDSPDTPNGSSQDFIANAWTAQGNFFIQRSLIRFDLSQIPSSSSIVNATLKLMTNLNTGHYQMDSGPNPSYFLRVLEAWNENTVTWNSQPSVSMNDPVIVPQSTSNTETYYLDLTQHVQDMVGHPESNYGWLFRQQTEEKYRCLVFASSDNVEPSWRPLLTIIYSSCMTQDPDFSFSTNNLEVTFQTAAAGFTTWNWDFGDGTTSGVQNPVHTFASSGDYQVCLTKTDSCGSRVKCKTVSVSCTPQVPDFWYVPHNLLVSFYETLPPGQVKSRLWNFGDGTTSPMYDPVHLFAAPGTYQVCLSSTDSCGTAVICGTVTVTCPLPQAGFSFTIDGRCVHFNDTTSAGTVLARFWDFGDSSYSAQHNPVHTYSPYYIVYYPCFSVLDSCGTVTHCDSVYFEMPMKPQFTSETSETNDLLVNFHGQSEGAAQWDWSFGDGEHSTLKDPSHLYPDYGKYQVCINVTNPLGTNSSCDSLLVTKKSPGYPDQGIVYPNPSEGSVNVKFNSDNPYVLILVTNSLGATLLQTERSSLKANEPLVINLTTYPKGLYFLRISTDTMSRVEKVIIR
jgi:PKD repeat protein